MYINSAACASAFITSKVLLILNRNRIRGSGAQLVLATSEAGLQRMDVVLDIQLSAFLHFSFARLLVYNPANDSAPLRDLTQLSLFQRLLPFSLGRRLGTGSYYLFGCRDRMSRVW